MGVARRRLIGAALALFVLWGCGRDESRPEPTASPTSPSPIPPASPSPTPDEPALQSIGEFNSPIYLTSPPGDERLFVVEQAGRIVVVEGGAKLEMPFLDITAQVRSGGERGLFSLAFPPDYTRSGLAYVSYTDLDGNSQVVEYRVSADRNRLDPGTARRILFQEQPFANHNGGLITFDPSGMLLIGLGDGGSANDPGNRAQNLGTFLGKILRVDPRLPSGDRAYGIPSNNPFVGREGALPEIWAYGLRNPWRFSFDPETNDLYLADVGQNRFEEVNFVARDRQSGANYGWRAYEGTERRTQESIDESNLIVPVTTYSLEGAPCAVVGGHVYRGEVNKLQGYYLYTDNCDGVMRAFKINNGQATEQTTFDALKTRFPSSFGVDSAGQVYITDLAGSVYRIVRKTP